MWRRLKRERNTGRILILYVLVCIIHIPVKGTATGVWGASVADSVSLGDDVEECILSIATVPVEERVVAVRELMKQAEADSLIYNKVYEKAEQILYNRASPWYNEACFILFLETVAGSSFLDAGRKERAIFLLDAARKNRVGTTAADFIYMTGAGRWKSLHRTRCKDCLLLLFYDSDCLHCKEVMAQLDNDATVRRAIADGRLAVLAVDVGGDRTLWEQNKSQVPAQWTVGFDDSGVADGERYLLSEMPVLYLLDRHKKVLLKEAGLKDLVQFLSRMN